jgi:hypothetical protein
MPEQLTKHPDETLQVLRSAGARCSEGAPQEILKACPKERFCKLPGGELCVYGLDQARAMTQITSAEWKVLSVPATGRSIPGIRPFEQDGLLIGGVGLVIGVAVAWLVSRGGRRRP